MTIPWLRRNFLARRRLDRWFLDLPDTVARRFSGRAHWPPYSLRAFVGAARDFEAAGRFFVEDLTALGLLPAGARMLDWGCGCGRVALPLAAARHDVLYCGVDVDRDCVAWCEAHLAEGSRVRFQHVDAQNASYNPQGAGQPVLPFADHSFDLMLATSVFTHLLPQDVERYLAEAGRLLAPGGVLYASAFLYGEHARDQQRAIPFPVDRGEYALHREDFPENAVAYRERWFRAAAERAGLTLIEPVRRGVQDVMLWMKPVEDVEFGSGWYGLEEGLWRWTAPEFEVVLPCPAAFAEDEPLEAHLNFRFHLPETLARGVEVEAWMEDEALDGVRFTEPGEHVYLSAVPASALQKDRVRVRFVVRHLDAQPSAGPSSDPRALGVQVVFRTLLAEHNRPLQPLGLRAF